jgi:hypothetical protein
MAFHIWFVSLVSPESSIKALVIKKYFAIITKYPFISILCANLFIVCCYNQSTNDELCFKYRHITFLCCNLILNFHTKNATRWTFTHWMFCLCCRSNSGFVKLSCDRMLKQDVTTRLKTSMNVHTLRIQSLDKIIREIDFSVQTGEKKTRMQSYRRNFVFKKD